MSATEWLTNFVTENWPFLLVLYFMLRGMAWWTQSIALANLSRRLDRCDRDEYNALKNQHEDRERKAYFYKLLIEIDGKLSRTNRILEQLSEKDQQRESKRRFPAERESSGVTPRPTSAAPDRSPRTGVTEA